MIQFAPYLCNKLVPLPLADPLLSRIVLLELRIQQIQLTALLVDSTSLPPNSYPIPIRITIYLNLKLIIPILGI